MVGLEPRRCAVRKVAVELDHDLVLGPDRIHQPPGDLDVHCRWGEGASLAEEDELLLEQALGVCELRAVAFEGGAQPRAARLAAPEHRCDLVQGDELEELGLGQRPAELREPHRARDVEQRLGGGGDREAVVPDTVDAAVAMHVHVRQ